MGFGFEDAEFDPAYERVALLGDSIKLFQRADRDDFLIVRWTRGRGKGEMAAVCAGWLAIEPTHNHLSGFVNSVDPKLGAYYQAYQFCPHAPLKYMTHKVFAENEDSILSPYTAQLDAVVRHSIAHATLGAAPSKAFLDILISRDRQPPAVPTVEDLIREDAAMNEWREHCRWSLSQLTLLGTDVEIFPPDQK